MHHFTQFVIFLLELSLVILENTLEEVSPTLGQVGSAKLALVWQQKHKSYVAMSSYSNGFIQNIVNGI